MSENTSPVDLILRAEKKLVCAVQCMRRIRITDWPPALLRSTWEEIVKKQAKGLTPQILADIEDGEAICSFAALWAVCLRDDILRKSVAPIRHWFVACRTRRTFDIVRGGCASAADWILARAGSLTNELLLLEKDSPLHDFWAAMLAGMGVILPAFEKTWWFTKTGALPNKPQLLSPLLSLLWHDGAAMPALALERGLPQETFGAFRPAKRLWIEGRLRDNWNRFLALDLELIGREDLSKIEKETQWECAKAITMWQRRHAKRQATIGGEAGPAKPALANGVKTPQTTPRRGKVRSIEQSRLALCDAAACFIYKDHPDWTKTEIARLVPCPASYLSDPKRCRRFFQQWEASKEDAKDRVPHGYHLHDEQGGGSLEASN